MREAVSATAQAAAVPQPPPRDGPSKKPGRGWKAAQGAVTGEVVPTELPDGYQPDPPKAAGTDKPVPIPAAPAAASDAGPASASDSVIARSQSPGLSQQHPTAPATTDGQGVPTVPASQPSASDKPSDKPADDKKPHRYANDGWTDSDEESEGDEESDEEASDDGDDSDGLESASDDEPGAAGSAKVQTVAYRETVELVDAVDSPLPPFPRELLLSDDDDNPTVMSMVLSAINGEATIDAQSLSFALRCAGSDGAAAIRGAAVAAEAGVPRARALRVAHTEAVNNAQRRIRQRFVSHDVFHSGEVSPATVQAVFGGMRGMGHYDFDAFALRLNFVRRLFEVIPATGEPSSIGFSELCHEATRFNVESMGALTLTSQRRAGANTLCGHGGGPHVLRAIAQLRFVATCFDDARFDTGEIEYERFLRGACPRDFGDGAMPSTTNTLVREVIDPDAELNVIRSESGAPRPFLPARWKDKELRRVLAVPPMDSEAREFVRRKLRDNDPVVYRELRFTTANLTGYITPADVPAKATAHVYISAIDTQCNVQPPARFEVEFDRAKPETWNLEGAKGARVFFQGIPDDIVYIEFVVTHPTEGQRCVAFATLAMHQVLGEGDETDVKPMDVALWVNGGTFFSRRKPRPVSGGGGCFSCAGDIADASVAGIVGPLPYKLHGVGHKFEKDRLRSLPERFFCKVKALDFLLHFRRQLFVRTTGKARCFSVLRQRSVRMGVELILDPERLDVLVLNWNAKARKHPKEAHTDGWVTTTMPNTIKHAAARAEVYNITTLQAHEEVEAKASNALTVSDLATRAPAHIPQAIVA